MFANSAIVVFGAELVITISLGDDLILCVCRLNKRSNKVQRNPIL